MFVSGTTGARQPHMSEGGDHTEDLTPEAKEWCRLVARILRRRPGDGELEKEADARAALTEYAKEEIETSEGPE